MSMLIGSAIAYSIVAIAAIIDEGRRAQWYLFGIFLALVIISTVLITYFNIWVSLLPDFLPPSGASAGVG
jgi:hypothetical protein